MWLHRIVHVLLLAAPATAFATSRENVVRGAGSSQHQGDQRRLQTWEQQQGVADYLRKHGKAKYSKKHPTQAPTILLLDDTQSDLVPVSIPRPTTDQQPPTDAVSRPTVVAPSASPVNIQSPSTDIGASPQSPSTGSIVPVMVVAGPNGEDPTAPTPDANEEDSNDDDDKSGKVTADEVPGSTPSMSPVSDTQDDEEEDSTFTVVAVPPASSSNEDEEDSEEDLSSKVESPESPTSEGNQGVTPESDSQDSPTPVDDTPFYSDPANGESEGTPSPGNPKDEKPPLSDDESKDLDESENGDEAPGSDSNAQPEQEWATESDVNSSVDGDNKGDENKKETISPAALLQNACDAVENGDDFVTNDSRQISYSYELLSYKENITLSDIVSKLEESFETFLTGSLVPCGKEADLSTDAAQIRGFSAGVPDKFVGGTCEGIDFYAEDIYFCYIMAGSMDVYLMDGATIQDTGLSSIVKETLEEEINQYRRKLRSSNVRRLNSLLNFEAGIVDLYMRSDDVGANQVTLGDIEARSPDSRNGMSGEVSAALVSISLLLLAIVGFATARKYRNHHGEDKTRSRIQGVVTVDRSSWMELEKESTASISYQDGAPRDQKYALPASLRATGRRDPPVGVAGRVIPETTIVRGDSTFGDWVDVDCQSIDWSQHGQSMELMTDKMRAKGWSPSASSPSSSFADGAPAIVSLAGSHTRDYELQNNSPSSATMVARQSKKSLFDFDNPSQPRSNKSRLCTSSNVSPIDHELLMLNGVVKTPSSDSSSLFSKASTPTQSPPSTGQRSIWASSPVAANQKGTDQDSPSSLFDHVNTVASHASSIFEGISKVFAHPEGSPASSTSRSVNMTGEVSNHQTRGRSRTPVSAGGTNSSPSSRSSTKKSSDYHDLEVRQQKALASAKKHLTQSARKQSTKAPQSAPAYSKAPRKSTSEREYPSQPDTVQL